MTTALYWDHQYGRSIYDRVTDVHGYAPDPDDGTRCALVTFHGDDPDGPLIERVCLIPLTELIAFEQEGFTLTGQGDGLALTGGTVTPCGFCGHADNPSGADWCGECDAWLGDDAR